MADADNRSSTEIQEDIEATRADLDRTISAIERKLTPGQVLDETLGYFRTRPGSGGELASWIRDNPVPVVLIGIGLAWMLFGPRGGGGHYAVRGRSVPTGPQGRRRAPDASVEVPRGQDSAALAEDLRRSDILEKEAPRAYGATGPGDLGAAPRTEDRPPGGTGYTGPYTPRS